MTLVQRICLFASLVQGWISLFIDTKLAWSSPNHKAGKFPEAKEILTPSDIEELVLFRSLLSAVPFFPYFCDFRLLVVMMSCPLDISQMSCLILLGPHTIMFIPMLHIAHQMSPVFNSSKTLLACTASQSFKSIRVFLLGTASSTPS